MRIGDGIVWVGIAVALSCSEPGPPGGGEPRILWKVSTGPPVDLPHEPVANVARSMVYAVTADYRLRKIRGSDGTVIWNVSAGAVSSTFPDWNLVLAGGNVVVVNVDLYAFDTATGVPRWTYAAPDLDATGYSAIVADDSTVYSASRLARVHAIDARTGIARWIQDLRQGSNEVGALNPSLADGTLYVCTKNFLTPPVRGTLWALDAAAGTVRWSYAFMPELPQQGSGCYGHAAVWQDLVIQPQADGRVFAFDRVTGQVRWIAPRVHNVNTSWEDHRFPTTGDSILIVTSDADAGMLTAYDPATGTERWRQEHLGGSFWPVRIEGNTMYVAHPGFYASYQVSTGALRWQTPRVVPTSTPTMLRGRPVVTGDRIVVAGLDGVYALSR